MNFRSGCRGRFRKFGKYLPRWVLSFHFNIQSPENEGRFGLTPSDLTVSLISYHTCCISSEKPRRLMDYPLSWLEPPLQGDTVTTLSSLHLYSEKQRDFTILVRDMRNFFFYFCKCAKRRPDIKHSTHIRHRVICHSPRNHHVCYWYLLSITHFCFFHACQPSMKCITCLVFQHIPACRWVCVHPDWCKKEVHCLQPCIAWILHNFLWSSSSE